MARKQNAFGGALGGAATPDAGGATLPSGQTPAPTLNRKQQSRIRHGVHGDPNNPYNTNIPGNITSGQGSFVANENPDDYWTWMNAKAGLNLNPDTPFGKWLAGQNDFFQQLYGAAKLDNPNLYFSNFMGDYGFGSPTQPNPKGGDGAGGGGAGGRHRPNANNQRQDNTDHGPDHKRKGGKGGRGGRGGQTPPPPSQGQGRP